MRLIAASLLLYASTALALTGYLVGSTVTSVGGIPYLQCTYSVGGSTVQQLHPVSSACPLTIEM